MEALREHIIFTDSVIDAFGDKYRDCCLHAVCLSGSVRLTMGKRTFDAKAGDVITHSSSVPLRLLFASEDFAIRALIISHEYLSANRPRVDYGVVSMVYTMVNPVLSLDEEGQQRILHDIEEIAARIARPEHCYFREVAHLYLETLILDFYDCHIRLNKRAVEGVARYARIFERFVALLHDERNRSFREVRYYAEKLFISPKYLSEACLELTGHGASYWIAFYSAGHLRRLLDTDMPLQDIAMEMRFASPSYLSRYTKQHLGLTPTEYRRNGIKNHPSAEKD